MSGTGQPSQEAMNAPRAATHGAVPVPVAARAACAGGAHTARTTTSQRTPKRRIDHQIRLTTLASAVGPVSGMIVQMVSLVAKCQRRAQRAARLGVRM